MSLIKVLSIIGTRPEAIKMASTIKALTGHPQIKSLCCITGQHKEMLDNVLKIFNIKPDYNLNIMKQGQDLTDITCSILSLLREVIRECQPDIILVQGDTTTSMSASLAAYYEKVPVGHIEAGLRTGDMYSPWPEEINRKIIGTIAKYHFAPTDKSHQNLINEGISKNNITVTGNTVIDALLEVLDGIKNDADFLKEMHEKYPFLERKNKKIILVTGHRRESFGDGFENICKALNKTAKHENVIIVYPVHMNPNVREPVFRILGNTENIKLIEPLDYRPFVYFMSRSYFILTDSGGVQEEAPSLGKPVLVMREVTERGEALASGSVKLVGTNYERIVTEANKLLTDENAYQQMCHTSNPYGDGKASQRILETILSQYA